MKSAADMTMEEWRQTLAQITRVPPVVHKFDRMGRMVTIRNPNGWNPARMKGKFSVATK